MTKRYKEFIGELSKKTLGNYVKKASISSVGHSADAFGGHSDSDKKLKDKAKKGITKRLKGIHRASDRLAKEEKEIDEISIKTATSYYDKRTDKENLKRGEKKKGSKVQKKNLYRGAARGDTSDEDN